MAPATPDLGEIRVEQGGEGERRSGGGDVVFPFVAELVVERRGRSGTGQAYLCRFRRQDISRPLRSPHGAHTCLIR